MNFLTELADDPEVALLSLLAHYRADKTDDDTLRLAILGDIAALLDSSAVSRVVTHRIEALYARLADGRSEAARGALGLYLFLNAARPGSTPDATSERQVAQASLFLGDEAVRKCLRVFYHVGLAGAQMRFLYDLPPDPSVALGALLSHYHVGEFTEDTVELTILRDVSVLLSDEAVADDVTRRIAAVYEHLATEPCPSARGALGLYLFLAAATAVSVADAPQAEVISHANQFLQDPPVKRCLRRFYDVGARCDLSTAQLYRIGTTSLIIKCKSAATEEFDDSRPLALKCVLPRYLAVRAIRDATAAYKTQHSIDHACVPRIYSSSESTITMDFIRGRTLAEELDSRAVPHKLPATERSGRRALSTSDIEFIRTLGLTLGDVLGDLLALGTRHLDLSPSNIIIVSEPSEKTMRVKLVDFGHNFAITERVGSSAAFARAATYVAPELLTNPTADDWRCDVYSLGVILLEAATKDASGTEDLNVQLDRLWEGEKPWDGAPGLARMIEDMIDERPEQRLALMAAPFAERDEPYGYINGLIEEETTVLKMYEARTELNGFGLLRGVALLRLWKNEQLLNLWGAADLEDPVDDAYRDFPALARWAAASFACWTLVLTAFVLLTAADLRFAGVTPTIEQLQNTTGAAFHVGAFWKNLPGRLVALTFSLTAVTYYVNNYSMLSPRRVGTSLGRWSDRAMRATALGLTLPILWAMVYNPQAWPLCSGIGTMLVVVNNYLAWRVGEHANEVGRRFSTLGPSGRRFVKEEFGEWWRLMGYYSLGMCGVGVLLLTEVAHDDRIYAYLVVCINLLKMYRLNCVEKAPHVRGSISRGILTLRRAARLEQKGVRPIAE